MKRPIGLILAVLVLIVAACLLLLIAGGMVFGAAKVSQHGLNPSASSSQPQLTANQTIILISAVAIFFLLLAAGVICAIVGLIGLRNWARYTVLTFGGLLAFLGLSSIIAMVALPTILQASQNPAQGAALAPDVVRNIVLAVGLFYGALAAVGVWWLIYFNLASVKAYFLPGYQQAAAYPTNAAPYAGPYSGQHPGQYPSQYPVQRQSAASLATPGGLTGEIAPYPLTPVWFSAPPPPPPGRLTHVPTSIIVIAILFFFATLSCAIVSFLPLPAFLCGLVLTGPIAPRLLYLAYAAVSLFIGIELLQLQNTGRLGVYVFSGLGFVNLLITLTPWGKSRYALYNTLTQAHLHTAGQATLAQEHLQSVMLLTSFFIISIFYGLQIWLIERHRSLFK